MSIIQNIETCKRLGIDPKLLFLSSVNPSQNEFSKTRAVRLTRPPATLYINPRIPISDIQLELIKERLRERIFKLGWNAYGQQTLPALSYDSPRGLFRFLTGKLYSSLRVYRIGEDRIAFEFRYPELIQNVLDDRYGLTFYWSKYESDFVDKLQEDTAREMDVDGMTSTELQTIRQERNKDLKRTEAYQEEQKKIYEDARARNEARPLTPEPEPADVPESDRVITGGVETHRVQYDGRAGLDGTDITNIENDLKSRIRTLRTNVFDQAIPSGLQDVLIDRRTIDSLRVSKSRSGLLTLRVVYYRKSVQEAERRTTPVYDFSIRNLENIDQLVEIRLAQKGLVKEVETKKI